MKPRIRKVAGGWKAAVWLPGGHVRRISPTVWETPEKALLMAQLWISARLAEREEKAGA